MLKFCLECQESIGGDVEAVINLNALELKGLIASALDLSHCLISPKIEIPAQRGKINYDHIDLKINKMRRSSMMGLESEIRI